MQNIQPTLYLKDGHYITTINIYNETYNQDESLFFSPLYALQNGYDEPWNDGKDDIHDKAKAWLFITGLYNKNSLHEQESNSQSYYCTSGYHDPISRVGNTFCVMPYCEALFIGAMCWGKRYYNENNGESFIVTNDGNNRNIIKPTKDVYSPFLICDACDYSCNFGYLLDDNTYSSIHKPERPTVKDNELFEWFVTCTPEELYDRITERVDGQTILKTEVKNGKKINLSATLYSPRTSEIKNGYQYPLNEHETFNCTNVYVLNSNRTEFSFRERNDFCNCIYVAIDSNTKRALLLCNVIDNELIETKQLKQVDGIEKHPYLYKTTDDTIDSLLKDLKKFFKYRNNSCNAPEINTNLEYMSFEKVFCVSYYNTIAENWYIKLFEEFTGPNGDWNFIRDTYEPRILKKIINGTSEQSTQIPITYKYLTDFTNNFCTKYENLWTYANLHHKLYHSQVIDELLQDNFVTLSDDDSVQYTFMNISSDNYTNIIPYFDYDCTSDVDTISLLTLVTLTAPQKEYSLDYFYKKYFKGACMAANSVQMMGKDVRKDELKTYLNAVINTINNRAINMDKNDMIESARQRSIDESQKDFNLALYIRIKQLWDKWLCKYYNHTTGDGDIDEKTMFDVKTFFKENFIFMDSFYKNIYSTFKMNVNSLYEQYLQLNSNNKQSVFSYLVTACESNHCSMYPLPNFVNIGNNDKQECWYNMQNIFKPYSLKDMSPMRPHHYFLIIYIPQVSSYNGDKNDFRDDSMDIWTEKDGTKVAPVCLQGECGLSDDILERSAYLIPAFGIAFSHQANSIFKSVSIGTSAHSETVHSIFIESQLAAMGGDDNNKVMYYGQDLYSLYAAYSYKVEVEMMGNMQISPLMYFQFMNIPIFRGTYMILNVKHTFSNGQMTTHFTGIKMTKYQPPATSSWFTSRKDKFRLTNKGQDADSDYTLSDSCFSLNGGQALTATNDGNLIGTKVKHLGNTYELEGQDGVCLASAIGKYIGRPYSHKNNENHLEWGFDCSFFVTHVYYDAFGTDLRNKACAGLFDYMQNELTLNQSYWKLGDNGFTGTDCTENRDKLTSVAVMGDILLCFKANNLSKATHTMIYLGPIDQDSEDIWVAEAGSQNSGVCVRKINNSCIVETGSNKQTVLYVMRPPRGQAQISCTTNKVSTNAYMNITESDVASYSEDCANTYENNTTTRSENSVIDTNERKGRIKYLMNEFVNTGFMLNGSIKKLNKYQAAAIVGVFGVESAGFKTDATNPDTKAYGLAQWLGDRKYKNFQIYVEEKQLNFNSITELTFEEQVDYCKWEFNRPYFKNTCQLWGNDINTTKGNMCVYDSVVDNGGYDENVSMMEDLTKRFIWGYEYYNSSLPLLDRRCKIAKEALELWDNL